MIHIKVPTEGLLTIDDALESEKVQNSIKDKFGFYVYIYAIRRLWLKVKICTSKVLPYPGLSWTRPRKLILKSKKGNILKWS